MESTRRKFMQNSGLGIAALLVAPYAKAYNNNKVLSLLDGNFEMLRNNVGFFTGQGGTIGWLVNKSGIAVVDSQFPASAAELISEIQKQGERRFDLLINTHHHGDHTGGNIAFKDIVDQVTAHENSKINQMKVAVDRNAEDKQLYPDTTFTDNWMAKIGDESISCSYHGQGHTNGDIFTHFENANIVHMGDLVFNRRFPYIDKSAGANIANWVKVLDKSTSMFDNETIFIFGHSGEGYNITGTKEDINAFKNYLEKLLMHTSSALKAGKSLDEMKAETKMIPGAPEWTGDGIERSLDAAYLELTEGK